VAKHRWRWRLLCEAIVRLRTRLYVWTCLSTPMPGVLLCAGRKSRARWPSRPALSPQRLRIARLPLPPTACGTQKRARRPLGRPTRPLIPRGKCHKGRDLCGRDRSRSLGQRVSDARVVAVVTTSTGQRLLTAQASVRMEARRGRAVGSAAQLAQRLNAAADCEPGSAM